MEVAEKENTYDPRHGKTQRKCFVCNRIVPVDEYVLVDENGSDETIVLSLGSRKAWELIGDQDTKVEVQGVGVRMKVDQLGKGKDKTKFKGKSGEEDQENEKKNRETSTKIGSTRASETVKRSKIRTSKGRFKKK